NEQLRQRRHRRLTTPSADAHGRMDDGHTKRLRRLYRRDDVLEQQLGIHGADYRELRRLIVDHDQRRILWGDQVIGKRVTFWIASHESESIVRGEGTVNAALFDDDRRALTVGELLRTRRKLARARLARVWRSAEVDIQLLIEGWSVDPDEIRRLMDHASRTGQSR